jgi:cytochrome c biogenesis protein CcmG, thiol:disulfide interchange protein DsbE
MSTTNRTAPAGRSGGAKTAAIVAGIVAIVAAALVAATLATSGDDAPERTEIAPVQVSGAPALPAVDDLRNDPAVGLAAPKVSGVNFDRQPVKVDPSTDNRPTLLVFGAHWCPHCQREFPELAKWVNGPNFPDQLRVVAVTTSTDARQANYPPSAWLDKIGWPGEVLVDDASRSAATAYGVSGFPYLVLVNANGTVAARSAGELPPGAIDTFVAQAS